MELDKHTALEILRTHKIEIDPLDSRSPEQFVTELVVIIKAIEQQKLEGRKAGQLRYESSQSPIPYFA